MIDPATLKQYPLASYVFEYLDARYVLFRKTAQHILAHFDDAYLAWCEVLFGMVDRRQPGHSGLEAGLKAFIRYSNEFLKLQARLNREGRYLHASFAEVNRTVYQSPLMDQYYLDGLFLSQVLWPNHYRMGLFFRDCAGCVNLDSEVLDVPSGTGIYSRIIKTDFRFKRLLSVDISDHSRRYTEYVLSSCPSAAGFVQVERQDLFEIEGESRFDFISCGELLEHVESPPAFLAQLDRLLKPTGTLFLTTAIYAAAIDHIWLFRNVAEVREMLRPRFHTVSELVLPVSLNEYQPDMDREPINYACVLRKGTHATH